MRAPIWTKYVLALTMVGGLGSASAFCQTYTTIYKFPGDNSGAEPVSSPTLDKDGNVYGVTDSGGAVGGVCHLQGCGVVYKLTPSGQETVLVTFAGESNGANPEGPLTLVGHTLYGSAAFFGPKTNGVLFTVHTDGSKFELLHVFSGHDGEGPTGPLVPAPQGGFYGITYHGGATFKQKANAGVLFKILPDGTYTRLHDFTGGADGANPSTLAIDSSGTLYGSTADGTACAAGCGVVFKYVPSTDTFTVLNQATIATGLLPMVGSIGPDGTVYGATGDRGPGNGGTLFDLVPAEGGAYSFNTLYQFGGHHPVDVGFGPSGGPLFTESGALIGTTDSGNESLYKFKFNHMHVLTSFPPQTDAGPPTIGRDSLIYGVGSQGGVNPCTVSGFPIPGGCGFVYNFAR